MMDAYFPIIQSIIKDGSKILDVGCGDGALLEYLKEKKNVCGRGLEISMSDVRAAVSKGLSVVQGDANIDLNIYLDKSYDYVILSNTLQAMKDVKGVLENLVRIGKRTIVVIPNFAHYSARCYLFFKGRMPVTENMPYAWYDTPNIHFCALTDFADLCKELGITVRRTIYLDRNGKIIKYNPFKNLFTMNAIYVLRKVPKTKGDTLS